MAFAKKSYFDRDAVIKAIGKARQGVMARQGGLIRTIMMRSMKKRKGHAPPGEPPSKRDGRLAKIEFAFDPRTLSVVIGPVKLGKSIAPEVLDKGGMVRIRGYFSRRTGGFVPLYLANKFARRYVVANGLVVVKMCRIEARPFSQPALEKALPKLAKEWKGAVKK